MTMHLRSIFAERLEFAFADPISAEMDHSSSF
jgi:hypothetical protein